MASTNLDGQFTPTQAKMHNRNLPSFFAGNAFQAMGKDVNSPADY
jgi:hypothetical protein